MWQLFSTMRLIWYFFVKICFHLFLNYFDKNQKKIKIGKVGKNDEKTEYIEKKVFILLKDIFNHVEGRKIPQVAGCLIQMQMELKMTAS